MLSWLSSVCIAGGLAAALPYSAENRFEPRPLVVYSWNLESPGHGDDPGRGPTAEIAYLSQRIVSDFKDADLVGFCEVEPDWLPALEEALEQATDADFQVALSPAGGHDRLAIAWRKQRFHRMDSLPDRPPQTLDKIARPFQTAQGAALRYRPSAFVRLHDQSTGQQLTFCVNHLARAGRQNGPWLRRMQARILRDWMTQSTLPVIATGDFNFDYDIKAGDKDNSGYTVLTESELVRWVRPPRLIPTQGRCAWENPEPCPYASVLDFVFVAGGARQWEARSEILERPDDFCPETQNSDHRPIKAIFQLPGVRSEES